MGDASSVDPNMGADPMAGGDPSMGGAPAGPDPMAGGDPMMGGGDAPMPDGDGMGGEEGSGDDSTMSLFDQLSDEDKEAARSYIESMLNKDESQPDNQEAPEGGDMPQMPMESVIFTKGQLKKLNEDIGLGIDTERDKKNLMKRTEKTNKKVKSSPFNSPKFE